MGSTESSSVPSFDSSDIHSCNQFLLSYLTQLNNKPLLNSYLLFIQHHNLTLQRYDSLILKYQHLSSAYDDLQSKYDDLKHITDKHSDAIEKLQQTDLSLAHSIHQNYQSSLSEIHKIKLLLDSQSTHLSNIISSLSSIQLQSPSSHDTSSSINSILSELSQLNSSLHSLYGF